MIINATYYTSGSLHIPNNDMVSRTRNSATSPKDELNAFINLVERELIINALNADLWETITDNYPLGVLNPSAPEWVLHLVNGHSYEIDGKSKVWDGLNSSRSCLVYYVFSRWFEDNLYSNQQSGLSQLKDNGSMRVDPTDFHQNQWNTFITKYQNDLQGYNLPIVTQYATGTLIDYYNNDNDSQIVTLLQFLQDYEELNNGTYTDITKKVYERLNSFGL